MKLRASSTSRPDPGQKKRGRNGVESRIKAKREEQMNKGLLEEAENSTRNAKSCRLLEIIRRNYI